MSRAGQGVSGSLLYADTLSFPNMKQKLISQYHMLRAFAQPYRAALTALVIALTVMLLLAGVALAATSRTAILCDSGEANCVEAWNGMNVVMYSDAGNTRVFKVDGSNGNITGKVLQYATPGSRQICSTQTITGTDVIAHGLATPQYVNVSLAQDATGDGARLSYTNASATVTIKVWNSALTPAAATTPVSVSWCAVGVP